MVDLVVVVGFVGVDGVVRVGDVVDLLLWSVFVVFDGVWGRFDMERSCCL